MLNKLLSLDNDKLCVFIITFSYLLNRYLEKFNKMNLRSIVEKKVKLFKNYNFFSRNNYLLLKANIFFVKNLVFKYLNKKKVKEMWKDFKMLMKMKYDEIINFVKLKDDPIEHIIFSLIFLIIFIYKIKEMYNSLLYRYTSQLKVVGRGYKIVRMKTAILYKMGFAHSFFIEMLPSLDLLKKKKKKKYFKFFSDFKLYSILIVYKMGLIRSINDYSGRGAQFYYKYL
uniref:Ribosomal protein L6 n=1 Tax=Acrasis kona TaxID=1008807 RepID=A0A0B4MZF0_9EUKA|nr:ribosomal protein L6 [Acrasis kona]AID52052.1 ribosomal protein L6 [Acrasis kona]